MKILYWNVYIGQRPAVVLRELKEMIAVHKPEIIGLGEATKAYQITDDVPGYRRIHLAPVRRRGNENADTAVLVRNDVKIYRKRAWRMSLSWFVPGRRVRHSPRVYIVVITKGDDGRRWRVAVGHWPFRDAQEETKRKVKRWFALAPRARSIFVGDLNARASVLRRYFKGVRVTGQGVDLALHKNCTATYKNLGKHGSDHPAILFTFK